jgi:hypothetical protein
MVVSSTKLLHPLVHRASPDPGMAPLLDLSMAIARPPTT